MNKFIGMGYFHSGSSICGSDFDKKDKREIVNPNAISSIGEIDFFRLPLTGNKMEEYATVSMINGEKFHLKKHHYLDLMRQLEIE